MAEFPSVCWTSLYTVTYAVSSDHGRYPVLTASTVRLGWIKDMKRNLLFAVDSVVVVVVGGGGVILFSLAFGCE